MSDKDGKSLSRYAQRKEQNDAYRQKIRRFTFQLSLHDGEVREWFERQPDKGAYLKRLILADKERELYGPQEEAVPQEAEVEKRMAQNYEIVQAVRIGGKEVVLGKDESSAEPYFCAVYTENQFCKEQFLKAVRKFMEMKTLTPTILHELVERIDVYQTQGRGKNRTQRIVIHYNFIGVLGQYAEIHLRVRYPDGSGFSSEGMAAGQGHAVKRRAPFPERVRPRPLSVKAKRCGPGQRPGPALTASARRRFLWVRGHPAKGQSGSSAIYRIKSHGETQIMKSCVDLNYCFGQAIMK